MSVSRGYAIGSSFDATRDLPGRIHSVRFRLEGGENGTWIGGSRDFWPPDGAGAWPGLVTDGDRTWVGRLSAKPFRWFGEEM